MGGAEGGCCRERGKWSLRGTLGVSRGQGPSASLNIGCCRRGICEGGPRKAVSQLAPITVGVRSCQAPTAVTNCTEVGEGRECPSGKVAGPEGSVMDAGERGSGLKMFSTGRWFLRAEVLY